MRYDSGEATQNDQGHPPQSNTFLDCNAIRTGIAE
jgi:hypothetical protein